MHKVFVYGTLRRGFGNHRLLFTSQFLGTDTVTGFTMLSVGNFYPALLGNGRSVSVITGEVYEVNDETFKSLDYLEGYPQHYNRMLVRTANGHEAWVYYYEENDRHLQEVPGGDWMKYQLDRGFQPVNDYFMPQFSDESESDGEDVVDETDHADFVFEEDPEEMV